MKPDQIILVNLSGRGEKDVAQAAEFLEGQDGPLAKKRGLFLPIGSLRHYCPNNIQLAPEFSGDSALQEEFFQRVGVHGLSPGAA